MSGFLRCTLILCALVFVDLLGKLGWICKDIQILSKVIASVYCVEAATIDYQEL